MKFSMSCFGYFDIHVSALLASPVSANECDHVAKVADPVLVDVNPFLYRIWLRKPKQLTLPANSVHCHQSIDGQVDVVSNLSCTMGAITMADNSDPSQIRADSDIQDLLSREIGPPCRI